MDNIIKRSLLVTFLVLFSIYSMTASARPKIGLVLSGGGAKGAAHIGVLKVLEANHVPIDYIVGTSIGSYIGGLYALGFSPDQIEDIMFHTQWDKGYSDFIPREDLLYEDKQLRDKYNITVRLGYSDGQLKMPSGLLLGQSALQLLKLSTDTVGEFDSFDNLAIPYRAVATDISTAKAVVLDHGSITQSMKASSNVPGALEPTEIEGRLLVDGGIANNMPVDIARKMGADIIIAVDIGSPLLEKKQINSTVDVLKQLSTILTITTTDNQKKLLGDQDILIRPDIEELSTTDFSILAVALDKGKQAALANQDRFSQLSLSEKEFEQYLLAKKQKSITWMQPLFQPVTEIEFDNQSKVNLAVIKDHFSIAVGDVVTKEDLESAIDKVYALDRFESVNAEFADTPTGRKLILTTKTKSWGPNYLKFGFDWQGDFSTISMFSLDFSYLLTDLTDNGGQWKNELSLGWESALSSEFYQPLDKHQRFFSRSRVELREEKFAGNDSTAGIRHSELTNRVGELRLGLGYHYTDYGNSEIGVVGELGDITFEQDSDESLSYSSLGAYISFGYDSLNSINFPTQGNKFEVGLTVRRDDFSPGLPVETDALSAELNVDWRGALGLGHHTFVGIASYGTILTDNDFSIRYSELGGFLNLSGYQKDSLIGSNKAFAAIVYQYDLGRDVPGGVGLPLYLGTSFEGGNVWQLDEALDIDDLVVSASTYLGTDTSFGPAVIGIGYATRLHSTEDDEITVFFSLGKNW